MFGGPPVVLVHGCIGSVDATCGDRITHGTGVVRVGGRGAADHRRAVCR